MIRRLSTRPDGRTIVRPSQLAWPAGFCILTVLAGCAYSFGSPVWAHPSVWQAPPDAWRTFHAAQMIGWGGFGDVYRGYPIITVPGLPVLLAPLAMVASHFGWSEAYPLPLAHPTAWIAFGPVLYALGSLVLFPIDAWARRLGASRRRGALLLAISGIAAWSVTQWGHPEDTLAFGCALYGLMDALDGRWKRSAWWCALAVVFQPLALLLLPLTLATLPARRWVRYLAVVAAPSLLLIAVPLVYDPHATVLALVDQPSFPSFLWPTPWLALTPVLTHTVTFVRSAVGTAHVTGVMVAAGPARILAVVAALVAGAAARFGPWTEERILWLAAGALAARCVFEAVLVPYYFAPALLLAVIVAVRVDWWRFLAVVAMGIGTTVWSYQHLDRWPWYLVATFLLAATWLLALPPSHDGRGRRTVADPVSSEARRLREPAPEEPVEPVGVR